VKSLKTCYPADLGIIILMRLVQLFNGSMNLLNGRKEQ
jgi:hypothetical protein